MTGPGHRGGGRARPGRDGGYTIVEVMVVIAVTVIGFLALTTLQAAVLKANQNAWNVSSAVQLARHVQETIRLEALEWNNDTYNAGGGVAQAKFTYLKNVGPPGPDAGSGWLDARFYPAATPFALVNQLGYQPGYDAGVLNVVRADRNQRFCVRYRLTWVVPNYLIRTDVRVLWAKSDSRAALYDACPGPDGPAAMEAHPEDVFSISMPSTVMKNVFVAP